MLMSALFATGKKWKQFKFPSLDEQINKMWYVHIMDYSSNTVLLHATTCMSLENIMLSERSYMLYDSMYMRFHPKKTNQHRMKIVIVRGWQWRKERTGSDCYGYGFLLGEDMKNWYEIRECRWLHNSVNILKNTRLDALKKGEFYEIYIFISIKLLFQKMNYWGMPGWLSWLNVRLLISA